MEGLAPTVWVTVVVRPAPTVWVTVVVTVEVVGLDT
jgi:hypothetical protein